MFVRFVEKIFEKSIVLNSARDVSANVKATELEVEFFIVDVRLIDIGCGGIILMQVVVVLHSKQPNINEEQVTQFPPLEM